MILFNQFALVLLAVATGLPTPSEDIGDVLLEELFPHAPTVYDFLQQPMEATSMEATFKQHRSSASLYAQQTALFESLGSDESVGSEVSRKLTNDIKKADKRFDSLLWIPDGTPATALIPVPEFELVNNILDNIASQEPRLFLSLNQGKVQPDKCSKFFGCGDFSPMSLASGDNDTGCTRNALLAKYKLLRKIPLHKDGSDCQPGEKMTGKTAALRKEIEAERERIANGSSKLMSSAEATAFEKYVNDLNAMTSHGASDHSNKASEHDQKEYKKRCEGRQEQHKYCDLFLKLYKAALQRTPTGSLSLPPTARL